MFGLALGTTAVWALVDAFWLAGRKADEAYRRWALGFARKLYTVALIWFAAAGTWYVFFTWPDALREPMFRWPWLLLTLATAASPGLPWLLLMTAGRWSSERTATVAIALGQFGVLGINAMSRQVVQNQNLKEFFDVMAQPTAVEWSPLIMFLIVFVLALAVIAWMIAQVRKCSEA